jgi:hypothetical protein
MQPPVGPGTPGVVVVVVVERPVPRSGHRRLLQVPQPRGTLSGTEAGGSETYGRRPDVSRKISLVACFRVP